MVHVMKALNETVCVMLLGAVLIGVEALWVASVLVLPGFVSWYRVLPQTAA